MTETHSIAVAVCQRCGNRVVDFGLVTIQETVIPGQTICVTQLLCGGCAIMVEAVGTHGPPSWFSIN